MKNVKVIGLGEAGYWIGKVLKSSNEFLSLDVSLSVCDVSINTLSVASLEGLETCYLENVFMHGLGFMGNVDQGEAIFHEKNNSNIIEQIMEDYEKIVIYGALDGGFSGGCLSYLSKKKMMDNKVHLYLVYPARFVHQRRIENANRIIENIKNSGLEYTLFYMDDIIEKNYDYLKENDRLKMKEVCRLANEVVAKEILKDINAFLEEK